MNGGMIVCPQPAAAEAGAAVLRRGGNAIDAAVTAALVQGVIDPFMCGIGGSGVMLIHLGQPKPGRQEVIEFYARAGAGVSPDQWEHLFIREAADRYGYVLRDWVNDCGYQSVGVPGTVAGLGEALRRHGTISWADALQPGIEAARAGMLVTGNFRNFLITDYGPDVAPSWLRIRSTPESRRIYTKDDQDYALGEVIANPDLALTFERLAEAGPEDFYHGEIAAAIVADFTGNGGFINAQDLAAYHPLVSEPVAGSYRGRRLVTAGPPAGGMTLLQMLNYLEGFELTGVGWPSTEAARRRVEAMGWAMAEREEHLADPLFIAVPVAELTAKEYAAAARAMHDGPTTTHVCVVDGAGNAVSMTHTLGSSSGVVTPGLGFMWNNYLNCFDPRPGRINSLAPGKTRVTMMAPTMVMSNGRPQFVLGAPGGTRIVNGVLQTLLNLIDHDLTPIEAVSAPRVDFQGETVQAELRIPADVLASLAELGFSVRQRPMSYDSYFSRVQLIEIDADGRLTGASDPRGDGGIALRG